MIWYSSQPRGMAPGDPVKPSADNYVYMTTDLDLARAYYVTGPGTDRRMGGSRAVYRVEPTSPLEPDPEVPLFPEVQRAASATVVEVVELGPAMTRRQALQYMRDFYSLRHLAEAMAAR